MDIISFIQRVAFDSIFVQCSTLAFLLHHFLVDGLRDQKRNTRRFKLRDYNAFQRSVDSLFSKHVKVKAGETFRISSALPETVASVAVAATVVGAAATILRRRTKSSEVTEDLAEVDNNSFCGFGDSLILFTAFESGSGNIPEEAGYLLLNMSRKEMPAYSYQRSEVQKRFVEEDYTEREDDTECSQNNIKEIIDHDVKLNIEDKKSLKEELGLSVENQDTVGTWRDSLQAWKEILLAEKLSDQLDSLNAKYSVEFEKKEVENSLRKDVVEKKLDSSEVAAVVFTEDLKRLYVTIKEGFPLEYTVDIPLDPFLFEAITVAGVEVDLLQKRQIYYFLKVVFA
ncbi:ATP-dependent zinc metalloprotease FTSH 12, chloroplastic [Olea europaea subsp. europaea]|uniref:ATP-dependent zinc metalloprotease FTSH 12, chloroplastic n=1 Tax=Olea europaea subsp. europaea TaxID=158383 RepID=A0A8S0R399_OLEEU|nr:ATP-dependent zinc metalloprotease FTSH 12, chloroplastic [Olea europaea subsp. europaea]